VCSHAAVAAANRETLALRQADCKEKTMVDSNNARIPLSLVTGFLGSGKTTFLKHVAARLAGRRIVYLVNDFSALDVDGAVLSEIGSNVVSVPGGSIFCKCLVGDFIDHLVRIAQQSRAADQPLDGVHEYPSSAATAASSSVPPVPSPAVFQGAVGPASASEGTGGTTQGATGSLPASAEAGTPGGRPPAAQGACTSGAIAASCAAMPPGTPRAAGPIDGLIVEASGIADPRVVADMLRQTRLDRVYDLARIVGVADPGSFHKLLATLPNIRSQIEAADTVLLNKIDLFDEPRIAATEAAMREINPRVRILRTLRAAADIDLFDAPPPRDLHGEYAGCADPHYERRSVPFSKPIDLAKLQAALTPLAGDLYRAKGFVPTQAGTVYLDFSAAGLSATPCDTPAHIEPGLAIIARAGCSDIMDAFIGEARSGTFDAE
jgi:G3E family GTPase